MDNILYSNLSSKKITKFISYIVARRLLSIGYNSIISIDINKEYKGKRCKGKLGIDLDDYKTDEKVSIDVDCYNITIKSNKDAKSNSYTLYPEIPKLKIIPITAKNPYSYTIKSYNLELFFELSNIGNINYDISLRKFYTCYAVPKKDIGILLKGTKYIIKVNETIKIYDLNNNLLTLIKIDYPMPILINSNLQKL